MLDSEIYVFGKDGATTVLLAGNEYNHQTEMNRLWAAAKLTEKKEPATFDRVTPLMP